MLTCPVAVFEPLRRVVGVDPFLGLDLENIVSRGYAFQEEVLWRLHRLGCRFAETPITFVDRRAGRSKMDLREAVGTIGNLFTLRLSN